MSTKSTKREEKDREEAGDRAAREILHNPNSTPEQRDQARDYLNRDNPYYDPDKKTYDW